MARETFIRKDGTDVFVKSTFAELDLKLLEGVFDSGEISAWKSEVHTVFY